MRLLLKGFFVDKDGEFGLSEFCTGIVDSVNNLEKISKVLNSKNFQNIIKAISVSKAEINRKVLKYFNKDFYKHFDVEEDIKDNNTTNKIIVESSIVKRKKNNIKIV